MTIHPGAAPIAFFALCMLMCAALGLLWMLRRGVRGLTARVARVEGLIEGLRDGLARQR